MKTINQISEEDVTGWIGRRTPLGLFLIVILSIVALSLFFNVLAYGGSWFREGQRVVSPQNVREQWQFAYDHDEALGAIAQNYCSFKEAADSDTNPETKPQRESQVQAQATLYNSRAAQYNSQLRDAFRAKLVRPRDVPERAPTLKEKTQEVCT